MKQVILLWLAWLFPITLCAGQLTAAIHAIEESNLIILENLHPPQLTGDFNGDGKDDRAYYVMDKATRKKGLCILNSGFGQCDIMGAGRRFYAAGDDFSWVNRWEVVKSGKTREATFKNNGDVLGTKIITLQNISIRLCEDEGGCGIVSYKGGKYIWVHQAD